MIARHHFGCSQKRKRKWSLKWSFTKMIAPQNSALFWEKQLFFKRKMKKSLKINEIWANLQGYYLWNFAKIIKIMQILILRKCENHKNQQFLNIFVDYGLQNLPVFSCFSILWKSLFCWVFSMFSTKISFPKIEVKMIAKMIIHQNDRFSNSLTKKL